MANFNTHIFVAAVASSLGATVCIKVSDMPISTALLFTAAGTVGGILPDIDLKYSVPSKLLFSILGAVVAMSWLFARLTDFSMLILWLAATALYLSVRYPLWWVFHQFTVHRGNLHSLSAALMFSFATAVLSEHVLHADSATSWMLAFFLGAGYLVHLMLDEIYSVDFMGVRVKRSFGTAFKIIDFGRIGAACMVLFTTLVLWFWTPSADEFTRLWLDTKVDWLRVLFPMELLVHLQPKQTI